MKALKNVAGFWFCVVFTAATAVGQEAPRGLAEEVGLDSGKLDRAKAIVQESIDKKQTAGVVTLIARRGKVVRLDAQGMMDIGAGKSMQPDTIFRIYSMSKPITSVAAAMLLEEGRIQLDDPVSKYLPEFKELRVYTGKDKEPVPTKREVTVRDLMRHTSGLTYGAFSNTGVDEIYRTKAVLNPNGTLADMITKLATIPLLYQPGTHFHYSVSTDVLGRVVEVVSGKTLDEFFQERICRPLDMKDTGFFVPEDKLGRFAANYGPDEKESLKVIDAPATSRYRALPKLFSGGGGLVSTARDYGRFCQMLLNGGEFQGTRLLRPETIQQMTSNQLPKEALPLSMAGINRPGVGFGLGFSVRMAKTAEPGEIGEYGWGGAASTHFWIAPKQELFVVILQQYMPFQQRLETALKPVIYKAITN